ncbi:hypothetical protein HPB48_013689 [Haemaphysalis longicornis]|uniref:Uncharacterized protein n=1 Tax=Haemaphysalis longicornis TaxID=44386 RepID=A0A9J6FA62_HAELO|nr:hypothetical protein HPB48_013689 [Haemaphysalis longicornis]
MTVRTRSASRFAKQGFRSIRQMGRLAACSGDKCPAARTMPSSAQMYQQYLPDFYEHDHETI